MDVTSAQRDSIEELVADWDAALKATHERTNHQRQIEPSYEKSPAQVAIKRMLPAF